MLTGVYISLFAKGEKGEHWVDRVLSCLIELLSPSLSLLCIPHWWFWTSHFMFLLLLFGCPLYISLSLSQQSAFVGVCVRADSSLYHTITL